MHIRQDAAAPAQPKNNAVEEIEKLRLLLAPNWAPLEKLCPPGLCEQFMFMGKVDGIHLYKHVDSRRYLNVDAAGCTYAYMPLTAVYYPIPVSQAMCGLSADSLDGLFSPAERAALALAIVKVRA
jgi:hypothetical protein